jgi:xanthine/uracil/vitamin C permease (AzgA family)
MQSKSLFGGFIFFVILAIGLVGADAAYNPVDKTASIAIGIGAFMLALLISSAIKIADPRDKAFVLRLGHFQSLRGPCLFLMGIGQGKAIREKETIAKASIE